MVKKFYRIMVLVTVAILSCAKLGDQKVWNNPGDPGGENWYPPVVRAPLDTDVAVNDTVSFFATGSDENGSIVRCHWSLDHGSSWSSEGPGSSPGQFTWSFQKAGTLKLWVKAEDNDGVLSSPDSFTVRVHEYRPVLRSVKDTAVSQLADVAIPVVAMDTNGQVVRYFWKTGSESAWSDSSAGPDLTFSHPQGGGLQVIWGVSDHDGFIETDTFTVLFNRGPASLAMLDPAQGDTAPFIAYDFISERGSVKLAFEAKDPDTSAEEISFRLSLGLDTATMHLLYAGTADNFQADSLLPSAIYYWKLTAKDRFGDSIKSSGSFLTRRAPGGPQGMALIRCADRIFQMGYPSGETYERQIHQVGFSYNFWIDTAEVSGKDFGELLGITGLNLVTPVANANWYDVVLYCNARSKRDKKDTVYRYASITGVPGKNCILVGLQLSSSASGYRLPSEAEWEYACRAGTVSDYYWGNNRLDADSYAWYHDNSNNSARNSGLKKPNAFNLYDMAGNLWEWCNDWFSADYYLVTPSTDPVGPAEGQERVIRGGSWMHSDYFTGSGVRSKMMPAAANATIGFRVVLRHP